MEAFVKIIEFHEFHESGDPFRQAQDIASLRMTLMVNFYPQVFFLQKVHVKLFFAATAICPRQMPPSFAGT